MRALYNQISGVAIMIACTIVGLIQIQANAKARIEFDSALEQYPFVGGEDVKSLAIYPNPAHSLVQIEVEKLLDGVSLRVMNLSGVEVMNQNFATYNSYEIDCSKWSSGIYIVNIRDSNNTLYTGKLLVHN